MSTIKDSKVVESIIQFAFFLMNSHQNFGICIPMEPKMKIFQVVMENFAAMGFTPNQQQNSVRRVNRGQIIDILFCVIDAVLVGLYIVFEANGIEEFMESIFSLTVVAGVTIAYTSIIFKNDEIFNIVKCFENELINSRDIDFWTITIWIIDDWHFNLKNFRRVQWESNITDNVRENYSSRWENKQNLLFCNDQSRIARSYSTRSYHLLFHLLHHGFGKRCLWIAIPCVVSLILTTSHYWLHFSCTLEQSLFSRKIIFRLLVCEMFRFPFDWKNPIGYLISVSWNSIVIFVLFRFLTCMVPLALGAYLFVFSVNNDWEHVIRTLGKRKATKPSKVNIFKRVTEFIRSHSNMKQLSRIVLFDSTISFNWILLIFVKID